MEEVVKYIPLPLYHYCGSESFYNIMSTKILRLSNIFETNDFLEKKYIDDIVADVFDRFASGLPLDKVQKIVEFKRKSLDYYKMMRDNPSYFIGLSGKGDLLSQWRGYAEDGTGFSIGFNMAYFDLNNYVPSIEDKVRKVCIFEVIYNGIRSKIENTVNPFLEKFKNLNYEIEPEIIIGCAIELERLAVSVKNPGFSEENEWRIIYTPILDFFGKVKEGDLKEINFNIKRHGSIVSFFELSFREDKTSFSPVVRIILGPKNKADIGTIRHFLSKNGFNLMDIHIGRSDLSYR